LTISTPRNLGVVLLKELGGVRRLIASTVDR
jgi:hypothetical protein